MGMPAVRPDPPVRHHWTAAQVRDLIDESRHWPRYELIGGELIVTPAPGVAHQIAVFEIQTIIGSYLEGKDLGLVLASPADLELEPNTITQPDVFVTPARIPGDPEAPITWADIPNIVLAVEILSPSSLRTDRIIKRDFYMGAGVPEYWIVDLDARMLERWTPARETPDVSRTSLDWKPPGAELPLTIDLTVLFERIWSKYRKLSGR